MTRRSATRLPEDQNHHGEKGQRKRKGGITSKQIVVVQEVRATGEEPGDLGKVSNQGKQVGEDEIIVALSKGAGGRNRDSGRGGGRRPFLRLIEIKTKKRGRKGRNSRGSRRKTRRKENAYRGVKLMESLIIEKTLLESRNNGKKRKPGKKRRPKSKGGGCFLTIQSEGKRQGGRNSSGGQNQVRGRMREKPGKKSEGIYHCSKKGRSSWSKEGATR